MDGCRLLVALALLASSASWADDVYKSVDADGHVVYSDHADPGAKTTIVHLEDSYTPPSVIHFCWTNCFTLELDHGVYKRADGSDETWTVERFTPASLLLHRHDKPADWNGFKGDVAYEGRISSEQLVDVTVNGRPVDDIQAAWGAALYTLPGNNAERDQRNSAPPGGPDAAAEVRAVEAPPPLQDDTQPPCPEDGYLWTPGYWAWGGGYHWIPGAWVTPPRVGLLWTPGYWAFAGTAYVFHRGYWGPQVGYYGGIYYGHGYTGDGFVGGRWVGNSFAYNQAVSHVNPAVNHHTYNEAPVGMPALGKASYNGGPGGTTASPTAQQQRPAIVTAHTSAPSATPLIARRTAQPVSAPPASVTRAVAKAAPNDMPNVESRPGAAASRPTAPKAAGAKSAQHPTSR